MNTQTVPTRSRSSHKFLAFVIVLVWFGLLGLAAYNRQNLLDWWRLRGYQAPIPVASIASEDALTPYARKVLYVNRPLLEDKTSFTQCANQDEKTIVLGCYHGNQAGIYVLTVSDARLDGVEQVTTAHEMLHAAYDRLSTRDKQHVNAMLQDYYEHDLHDQRILDTINAYKQSEPDDLVNEMHSIFGTEVVNLPSPLEQYYQRYFTDRSKVTAYAAQYEGEFTSRQAAIKTDDAKLASLKAQIESQEADLTSKGNQLQSQQAQMKAYRSSGDIARYNALVPGYNQLVGEYNDQVASVKALITQYNQLVDERNAIALEAQTLQNEISGQPSTISQ